MTLAATGTYPQGTFEYPGIDGVLSATMTMSNGINPAVMMISIEPTSAVIPKYGTAVWRFGSVSREFPNCSRSDLNIGNQGGLTIWEFTIQDRRWAWRNGQISGEYNRRKGNEVIPIRKKNPQQLATMCLEAMGEDAFDVAALPDNDYPFIEWELTVPARALADVADMYGCEIAYLPDNSVQIVKKGEGAVIPNGYMHREIGLDHADLPSKLAVVTAPTQWQVELPLGRNVGWDFVDRKFKDVDDLPYKPAEGWQEFADYDLTEDDIEADDERAMAAAHVWKTYELSLGDYFKDFTPPDPIPPDYEVDDPTLPGMLIPLTDVDQLTPFVEELVEKKVSHSREVKQNAFAFGNFFDARVLDDNVDDDFVDVEDYLESNRYKGSFTIDPEEARVTFSDKMFMYEYIDRSGGGVDAIPTNPNMYVTITVTLSDLDTGETQRLAKVIDIDTSSPGGTKYIFRDDIVPQYYKAGTWANNLEEVEQQCDFYLDLAKREYLVNRGERAEYQGFIALANDGAIKQVTYSIDGNGVAKTTVARNMEDNTVSVTYKQARERQKIAEALADKEKEKRDEIKSQRREKLAKRRESLLLKRGVNS